MFLHGCIIRTARFSVSSVRSDRRSEPEHSREDRAQHPVGRVGRVEDIVDAVAWLAGEGAGFVTGQEIVVDGGMTRRMIYAD